MAVPRSPHPRKEYGPAERERDRRGREIETLRAEREAGLRVVEAAITRLAAIEWHGDSRGDDVQSIVGGLVAYFGEAIAALESETDGGDER